MVGGGLGDVQEDLATSADHAGTAGEFAERFFPNGIAQFAGKVPAFLQESESVGHPCVPARDRPLSRSAGRAARGEPQLRPAHIHGATVFRIPGPLFRCRGVEDPLPPGLPGLVALGRRARPLPA